MLRKQQEGYIQCGSKRKGLFSKSKPDSILSMKLLLPSCDRTKVKCAEFVNLAQRHANPKSRTHRFFLSSSSRFWVTPVEFSYWFEGDELNDRHSLTQPIGPFEQMYIAVITDCWVFVLERLNECWYGQHHDNDITEATMIAGIKDSLCYILLLSREVFRSKIVPWRRKWL